MSRKMTTSNDDRFYEASQDITGYTEYAKNMRSEIVNHDVNFRSFAVIPDIVAIDIHTKYKIDIHDDEQMKEPVIQKRIRGIIKKFYPYLLTGGITNRFNLGGKF